MLGAVYVLRPSTSLVHGRCRDAWCLMLTESVDATVPCRLVKQRPSPSYPVPRGFPSDRAGFLLTPHVGVSCQCILVWSCSRRSVPFVCPEALSQGIPRRLPDEGAGATLSPSPDGRSIAGCDPRGQLTVLAGASFSRVASVHVRRFAVKSRLRPILPGAAALPRPRVF